MKNINKELLHTTLVFLFLTIFSFLSSRSFFDIWFLSFLSISLVFTALMFLFRKKTPANPESATDKQEIYDAPAKTLYQSPIKSPRKKFISLANTKLLPDSIQNYFSQYISKGLNDKLEANFYDFKNNPEDPLIITLIQYKEKGEQVYLIAKDPAEPIFYGIMEGKFVNKKDLQPIPVSEITALEFKEIFINPFRAKKYIDCGIKEPIRILPEKFHL